MQQQLGVDEPDFGALFADMVVEEGDPIPVSELIQAADRGGDRLRHGDRVARARRQLADALRAVAGALPALEIIDSRVADWKIKLPDTIADNASSARVVCGGRLVPIADLDLRTIGMVLTVDGAVAATGAGAAVLGNPIRCVAWLANKLGEFGGAAARRRPRPGRRPAWRGRRRRRSFGPGEFASSAPSDQVRRVREKEEREREGPCAILGSGNIGHHLITSCSARRRWSRGR